MRQNTRGGGGKVETHYTERITNLSELEAILNECYIEAQLLKKESPHLSENFQMLINKLEKAINFEFCIEVRKTEHHK